MDGTAVHQAEEARFAHRWVDKADPPYLARSREAIGLGSVFGRNTSASCLCANQIRMCSV